MDSIHLHGAEDVRVAGSRMVDAADTMRSAASNIDGSMENFKRFMDDWLQRFEAAVDRMPVRIHDEITIMGGDLIHGDTHVAQFTPENGTCHHGVGPDRPCGQCGPGGQD